VSNDDLVDIQEFAKFISYLILQLTEDDPSQYDMKKFMLLFFPLECMTKSLFESNMSIMGMFSDLPVNGGEIWEYFLSFIDPKEQSCPNKDHLGIFIDKYTNELPSRCTNLSSNV
jgi:hypothetical protein